MSLRLITFLVLASMTSLGGCSKYMSKLDKVLPDERQAYKKSESLPDLEVPPDLTTDAIDDSLAVPDIDASGAASFSEYEDRVQRQRDARFFSSVTDDASGISDVAGELYFVVDSGLNNTWTTLSNYWTDRGYSLGLQDQELGVMETNWQTAGALRERYKLFIEPAQTAGATAIYLSRSVEENDRGAWVTGPRDLPAEHATAVEIQTALGGAPVAPTRNTASNTASTSTTTATPVVVEDPLKAEIVGAGGKKMYLAVNRDVDTVWPNVGVLLGGYTDVQITSEDRSNGTYSITFSPESAQKKGLIKKLAFWKDADIEMQVQLSGVGENTEIVILDDDGDWDTSDYSDELLQRLRSGL